MTHTHIATSQASFHVPAAGRYHLDPRHDKTVPVTGASRGIGCGRPGQRHQPRHPPAAETIVVAFVNG
jgi:hypothetical protein